jgi:hypothetical protein
MDLAHLVDGAGVKKNTLGRRRLAGVNVRGNADVARPLERERAILRIDRRNLVLVGNDSNVEGDATDMLESSLPAEVGKGAVSLRHLVGLFLLLHNGTSVVVGVDNLGSEASFIGVPLRPWQR